MEEVQGVVFRRLIVRTGVLYRRGHRRVMEGVGGVRLEDHQGRIGEAEGVVEEEQERTETETTKTGMCTGRAVDRRVAAHREEAGGGVRATRVAVEAAVGVGRRRGGGKRVHHAEEEGGARATTATAVGVAAGVGIGEEEGGRGA